MLYQLVPYQMGTTTTGIEQYLGNQNEDALELSQVREIDLLKNLHRPWILNMRLNFRISVQSPGFFFGIWFSTFSPVINANCCSGGPWFRHEIIHFPYFWSIILLICFSWEIPNPLPLSTKVYEFYPRKESLFRIFIINQRDQRNLRHVLKDPDIWIHENHCIEEDHIRTFWTNSRIQRFFEVFLEEENRGPIVPCVAGHHISEPLEIAIFRRGRQCVS